MDALDEVHQSAKTFCSSFALARAHVGRGSVPGVLLNSTRTTDPRLFIQRPRRFPERSSDWVGRVLHNQWAPSAAL